MTPAQLRTKLATLLAGQLGTYSQGGQSRGPALVVGEPPSDYRATGLEVRIDPNGEFDNRPVHAGTSVVIEIPIRFVQHGPGSIQAAVIRACQALNATNPTSIPPNESLGILAQYTARVRSN